MQEMVDVLITVELGRTTEFVERVEWVKMLVGFGEEWNMLTAVPALQIRYGWEKNKLTCFVTAGFMQPYCKNFNILQNPTLCSMTKSFLCLVPMFFKILTF